MNSRQEKFIAAYIEHGNGTRAALEAGYSERSAASMASRMLKNRNVAQALQDARTEARSEGVATLEEAMTRVTTIMRTSRNEFAVLQAVAVLERLAGWVAGGHEETIIRVVYTDGPDCPPARAIPAKVEYVNPLPPRTVEPKPKPEPVPDPAAAPAPVVPQKPKSAILYR